MNFTNIHKTTKEIYNPDDYTVNSPPGIKQKKTLVIYVFHVVNSRVKLFIQTGVFFHPSVEFLFVCNDPAFNFDILRLPPFVRRMKRENKGFDFGAYSCGVMTNNLYTNYDNFIFLNSSCIGPYISPYYTGKWTDIFINGLKDNVKIFGSMINTEGMPIKRSHVQTNIFAIDKETLIFLIDSNIFSMTKFYTNQNDCVLYQEILMSQLVLHNGWNIGCLFPGFKNIDFSFKTKQPHEYDNKTSFLLSAGDLMYPRYRYTVWDPFQLVFYKGNRFC